MGSVDMKKQVRNDLTRHYATVLNLTKEIVPEELVATSILALLRAIML